MFVLARRVPTIYFRHVQGAIGPIHSQSLNVHPFSDSGFMAKNMSSPNVSQTIMRCLIIYITYF